MVNFYTVIPNRTKTLFKGATLTAVAFLCSLFSVKAQVTVTPNQTAAQLAQKLLGPGVTLSNPTLTCPTNANGIFVVTSSNIGLDSGIVMTSGQAQTSGTSIGVNGTPTQFASNSNGAAGDANLTTLAGQNTFDACVLEFDFVPAGDTVKFDYTFGSEEYPTYNCSINDVFGFFISGPGITGQKNIALIPGTTYPVAISTINNGVGAQPGNPCYTNTGGNGPYTQYYVNNTGTSITYTGFTTVLQAISAVTPCTTYHLKIAISDASDYILDSGVFLKAGSLTSNAISVTPIGGGGLTAPTPYCVRGCLPGQFVFSRPVARPTPLTVKYQIVGTAVNGSDYTLIPDSVVIPANGTTATRLIYGLPVPPTGPKTVKLRIYSPYTCGSSTPIIDSAEMTIYDSLQMHIVSPYPDTAICRFQSVPITVFGDTLLTYNWTPATGLNNPTAKNPVATPLTTTTYTVTATLPGSGCAPVQSHTTIIIKQPPVVNAGADRTTCLGTPFQFNTTVTPATQTYTYSWSPASDLSNASISNPVFTPSAVTNNITYVVTANPGAAGCSGYDTVNVRVLPNDFTLFNHDTSICFGAVVQMNVDGDAAFTYTWTPANNVSNPNIASPTITPDTTTTYTVTASYPTCPNVSHSVTFDVQPNPVVYVGADRAICQWDTLQVHPVVTPTWYTNYSYDWTPAQDIDFPNQKDIVFSGWTNRTLTLTVTTPAGCTGNDNMQIVVHPGNFAAVSPADTAICPLDSVTIVASGGVHYTWTPSIYLTDTNSATFVSHPTTNVNYIGYVTDQFGCKDTLYSNIVVHPHALLELGDTVTIYPGESYQMDPTGNCLYFQWFPPLGLSADNIANPVAMPDVNTRYIVQAATENGCTTTDTIVVMVNPETLLDMPNAFSPGSAPNDILKINKRGIATLKYFRIFNRWGTKVFETSDIDQGWNGQYNGNPQPMGVYVYMIEAYTNTGRRFYKQGNVTLIR